MNPHCVAQRSDTHSEPQVDEYPACNAAWRPRLSDGGLLGLSEVSDSGASLKLSTTLKAVEGADIVFFSAVGACLHLVFGCRLI